MQFRCLLRASKSFVWLGDQHGPWSAIEVSVCTQRYRAQARKVEAAHPWQFPKETRTTHRGL